MGFFSSCCSYFLRFVVLIKLFLQKSMCVKAIFISVNRMNSSSQTLSVFYNKNIEVQQYLINWAMKYRKAFHILHSLLEIRPIWLPVRHPCHYLFFGTTSPERVCKVCNGKQSQLSLRGDPTTTDAFCINIKLEIVYGGLKRLKNSEWLSYRFQVCKKLSLQPQGGIDSIGFFSVALRSVYRQRQIFSTQLTEWRKILLLMPNWLKIWCDLNFSIICSLGFCDKT